MKNFFLFIPFFYHCLVTYSQPSNNDCTNATVITLDANGSACINGTTTDATSENLLYGTCNSSGVNEVWFSFIVNGTQNDITINPNTLQDAQIVIDNICGDGNFTACDVSSGSSPLDYTNSGGLFVGTQILIGVMSNTGNEGSFEICIDSYTPLGTAVNDECANATMLCPGNTYVSTTSQSSFNPDTDPYAYGLTDECFCNGVMNNTVWFTFTTPSTLSDVNFDINSHCSPIPGSGSQYDGITNIYGGGLQFEVFERIDGLNACDNRSTSGIGTWGNLGSGSQYVYSTDWNCVTVSGYTAGGPDLNFNLTIPSSSLDPDKQYYVVVDNFPGCECDFDFLITGNADVEAGPDETFCFSDSPTSLTGFSPSGGTWSGTGVSSDGTFDPSTGAGNYTVSYTALGCTDTKEVVVTNSPTISSSFLSTTCGLDNGSITITATGGTGTLNYSVDGGTTSQASGTFTGLSSGSYNITVEDASGCQTNDVVNVGAETSISIDNIVATDASCGVADGSLTITTVDAVGAVSYTIDNGSFTDNNSTGIFNNLTTGTYNITVLDDAGCSNNDSKLVSSPAPPTLTISQTTASCGLSDGTFSVVPSGGLAPFTYTIVNGSFTDNNTSGDFINLPVASFTLTVLDDAGCELDSVVNIISPSSPSITSTVNATSCGLDNGEISLVITGGTGGYNITIDNGVDPTQNDPTGPFTSLTSGSYTITVLDDANCTATEIVDVLSSTSPSIDIVTPIATTCNLANGELTITAIDGTSPFTFTIDNGVDAAESNTTGIFSALSSGTYSITIEDDATCQAPIGSADIAASQELLIDGSVNTLDASCGLNNGEITIPITGGTAPVNYTIGNGVDADTTNTIGSFSELSSGTYTISLLDDVGCTVTSSAILLDTVLTVDSITHQDVSCFGAADAEIVIYLPPGSGTATYSNDNGTTSQTTGTFANLSPGIYELLIENTYGCTVIDTVEITTPAEFIYSSSGDTSICVGGTASSTVEITGGTGLITYTWNDGTVGDAVSFTTVNDTTVKVYGEDEIGCVTDTTYYNIIVYPLLTLVMSSDITICENDSTDISGIVTGGIGAPYTYSWDNSLTDTSHHNVQPTNTTSYSLTVTDGCETPAVTGLVEVTINPLPVVVFTADTLIGCLPLEVNFEELFSSNLGSCSWDFGDFITSTVCNTVTHEYNTSGCFDVSLTYTDNLNCVVTQSYADYVCVNENPVADFMFSPQEPSLLLEPNVSFTSSSISADQYLWELGDSNTTYSFTTENFDYSFANYNPGDYPICLTVYTTEGCVDSLCQTITVTDDFLFYIPNSFTPGGDGRNDSFGPIMRGVTENYTFNVYDRWGEMVFKSDATTPMWAGDFNNNGELCPMGVYVWKIELFDDVNRIPKEFIGNVTLIR